MLVHIVTSPMMAYETALLLDTMGVTPIMTTCVSEIQAMQAHIKGCLINLGMPDREREQAIKAYLVLYEKKQPQKPYMVLDPVGCHNYGNRLNMAINLLKSGRMDLIKCHYDEGLALLKGVVLQKGHTGVKSAGAHHQDRMDLAGQLCEQYQTSVVITGPVDVIALFSPGQPPMMIPVHHTGIGTHNIGQGCLLGAFLLGTLLNNYATSDALPTLLKQALQSFRRQVQKPNYFLPSKRHKIYAITPDTLGDQALLTSTETLLKGGIDYLQFRSKTSKISNRKSIIIALKHLCEAYGVPLIMNDDVNEALAFNVEGAHLGTTDIEKTNFIQLKKISIFGMTAKTPEAAIKATVMGATYLGVGAIYPSSTKPDAVRLSLETLAAIRSVTPIPLMAIGGLTPHNLTDALLSQVDGVVMSAALYNSVNTLTQVKARLKNYANKL